jgi:hypothetical protein
MKPITQITKTFKRVEKADPENKEQIKFEGVIFEVESIRAELITLDKYNDHISDQTIETMEALGATIWMVFDSATSGKKCYCRIILNATKTEISKTEFVIPNPEFSDYYLDLDKGL